jgi:hypothetical protein
MITKQDNWTEKRVNDFNNIGTIEYVGNAHYYFSKLINSSNEIRRSKNPHCIKYQFMIDKFGEPNFEDDKGSQWWILLYKSDTWAVDTNEHEGSGVWRFYNDNKQRMYDRKHSEDMYEFIEELLK